MTLAMSGPFPSAMLWGGTQEGIPTRSHVRPGTGGRPVRLLGVYREGNLGLQAASTGFNQKNLRKIDRTVTPGRQTGLGCGRNPIARQRLAFQLAEMCFSV